jgi:hypothetical protein
VERFPSIEPFERGMLEVGDGQRVSWEASGNPDGRPPPERPLGRLQEAVGSGPGYRSPARPRRRGAVLPRAGDGGRGHRVDTRG